MQIFDQNSQKCYSPKDFSAGLSDHAGGVGWAVEPEKWRIIEFENKRGEAYRRRKMKICELKV